MIIRKIETKDSEKFLNMLKQLDNETTNMMWEPGERKTTIDEMDSDINNICNSKSLRLVAEDKGHIIGFLSSERGFAKRISHRAYIVIGILRDYRGKKIGVKLFEELEKWALENRVTRLELTVMEHNEGAIKLYKKMGFKKEGLKENSLIVDGKYVAEYYMGKII